MADEPLTPGRGYWLKLATQTVTATIQQPKYEIDVNSLEHLAAKTLELNQIGVAEVFTPGAPMGDVFSFMSGLYFRGKLAYARAFATPPAPRHDFSITLHPP